MRFGKACSYIGLVSDGVSVGPCVQFESGLYSIRLQKMFSRNADTMPASVALRKRKLAAVGFAILSGIALVCGTIHFGLKHSEPKPSDSVAQYVAELVHASGMVLVRNPGKSEWQEMKTGARLMEGDLVRTDSSGEAGVRYRSGTMVTIPGTTVFTVRSVASDRIEVSASPGAANIPLLPKIIGDPAHGEQTKGAKPVCRIAAGRPFRPKPGISRPRGSRKQPVVNNEIVEVAGDGTFRHFTRPLSCFGAYGASKPESNGSCRKDSYLDGH